MIKDLDLTIRNLLQSEAETGSDLASANISFALPDGTWQGSGDGLDLNIYLYDIRKNLALRTNERQINRNPDGSICQKTVPPRIDCTYLITAWKKSAGDTNEEKELQEHRLLSQVLHVMLKQPLIPSRYLQGSLKDQEPSLPLITAYLDGPENPSKFWDALGSPLKPSINCMITISLDIKKEFTGKMVINNILDYMEIGKPGSLERVIQIGGRIMNSEAPPSGIKGAVVIISDLNRKTNTDQDGFFTFTNLNQGKFQFKVSAEGYKDKKATLNVPSPAGENYDFRLVPQ